MVVRSKQVELTRDVDLEGIVAVKGSDGSAYVLQLFEFRRGEVLVVRTEHYGVGEEGTELMCDAVVSGYAREGIGECA